jgi:hypothetical protein
LLAIVAWSSVGAERCSSSHKGMEAMIAIDPAARREP